MMLENIKILLEENAIVFLSIFLLSLIANLFEITGFFRERRKRKEEEEQRAKDEERLRIYEFLFETAQRSITTEAELEELRNEILQRQGQIPQLEKRIEVLQLAAKREIVSQNILRTISDLRTGMEELQQLKQIHSELGDLPDLPPTERRSIEHEITSNTHKLYEFPRALTYRSLVLALLILLLPPLVDQILIVAMLGLFLTTFFEITSLSGETTLIRAVFSNKRTIGFLSCLGAWYFLIQAIEAIFGSPIFLTTDALAEVYRQSWLYDRLMDYGPFWMVDFLVSRSSIFLYEFVSLGLTLLFAVIHWRQIRDDVLAIQAELNPR